MSDLSGTSGFTGGPGVIEILATLQDLVLATNALGAILQDNPATAVFAGIFATGTAFAGLPVAPVTGMIASITDSSTAVWGAVIAGGGANAVLAWYNGADWTVIGI